MEFFIWAVQLNFRSTVAEKNYDLFLYGPWNQDPCIVYLTNVYLLIILRIEQNNTKRWLLVPNENILKTSMRSTDLLKLQFSDSYLHKPTLTIATITSILGNGKFMDSNLYRDCYLYSFLICSYNFEQSFNNLKISIQILLECPNSLSQSFHHLQLSLSKVLFLFWSTLFSIG